MGKYLDQLRHQDSLHPVDAPTQPTKASSVSCVGASTEGCQKNAIARNAPSLPTNHHLLQKVIEIFDGEVVPDQGNEKRIRPVKAN